MKESRYLFSNFENFQFFEILWVGNARNTDKISKIISTKTSVAVRRCGVWACYGELYWSTSVLQNKYKPWYRNLRDWHFDGVASTHECSSKIACTHIGRTVVHTTCHRLKLSHTLIVTWCICRTTFASNAWKVNQEDCLWNIAEGTIKEMVETSRRNSTILTQLEARGAQMVARGSRTRAHDC